MIKNLNYSIKECNRSEHNAVKLKIYLNYYINSNLTEPQEFQTQYQNQKIEDKHKRDKLKPNSPISLVLNNQVESGVKFFPVKIFRIYQL